MSEVIGLTKSDLQQILASVMNASSENIATAVEKAIAASKALPPEVQMELDDKKARLAKSKQEWRTVINYENEQKVARVTNCPHKKENGRWCISGQIVGGKDVLLVCIRCQGIWRVKITPEQKSLIEHGDIELLGSAPPVGVPAIPA